MRTKYYQLLTLIPQHKFDSIAPLRQIFDSFLLYFFDFNKQLWIESCHFHCSDFNLKAFS